jgi:hypothetical protein
MEKVYIAGPYTLGDPEQNVFNAMRAANEIMNLGLAPFLPHLWHYQHLHFSRPYQDWLELDLIWLRQCDAVLRLPGESHGAEREVELATLIHIPVFKSIEELAKHYKRVSTAYEI